MIIGVTLTALWLLAAPAAAGSTSATPPAPPTEDPVFRAMADEQSRTATLTLAGAPSPHYVAYHVFDTDGVSVVARFGALTSTGELRARQLIPMLRVGTDEFDASGFPSRMDLLLAPVEDDYDALRHWLWMLSDDVYKAATERFSQEQAFRTQTTRDENQPNTFSKAPAAHHVGPVVETAFDRKALESMALDASKVFRQHPDIQASGVSVVAVDIRHRFLASDGAFIDESLAVGVVEVSATTQAEDGMPLRRSGSIMVMHPATMPSAAEVTALAEAIAKEADLARTAPVVDSYDGPVLFEAKAAAQLLAYVLPQELIAMPFMAEDGRLDRRVLPTSVSIIDDPTLDTYAGKRLYGHYEVDFEGVAAQRVELVKAGQQVGMLMGRTPNREVDASNGHARGAFPGMTMVTPGNLIVTAKGGKSDKALRSKLRELMKKEGSEHGYIVTDMGDSPWSPAHVLRIDAKGNTQPVRVDQMRMPEFKDLRRIVDFGDTPVVHNYMTAGGSPVGGIGGGSAESVVPASIVAPAVLFDRVEIKKSTGDKPKPPPYPHPYFDKKK